MRRIRIYKVIFGFLILFSLGRGLVYSYEDGFAPAKKIESNHFTIYCAAGLEFYSLARQLNIGASDLLLTGKAKEGAPGLTDMVDNIFARVCDILDMQLYSYKGNIKVCKDSSQLKSVYKTLFNSNLSNESFYVYELNTIYISEESFKLGVLGHEIAHAIICHYFVVLPSVKVQEVLAGYVEYQLRHSRDVPH